MYKYKTIIFDLDGTLFKTDMVFLEAVSKVCSSRGIKNLPEEKLIKLIGEPSSEILKLLFNDSMDEEQLTQIQSEISEMEQKLIADKGELYDGVKEMLNKLINDEYTLCICSNGSEKYVNNVLVSFGITKYFPIIKTKNEGLIKSQLIKQILDESECTSAIMVGDRFNDFDAALDVGCLSIGATYGYGGYEWEGADFKAQSPLEIFHIISNINGLYNQLTKEVISKKKKDRPLLVGINGVDTSGKTIFTKNLANYLKKLNYKVQVIHLDDFHNPSEIRLREPDPVTTYFNNAFNLNRIEEELLKPIANEGVLYKELLLLDLEKDVYSVKKQYEVDINTIVLFEGVLLYREPIDKYFDYRIYLDISFDEVIIRALKRDRHLFGDLVTKKYQEKYIPVQESYIQLFNPMEKSDIVINNEDYNNPKIIYMKSDKIKNNSSKRIKLRPAEIKYLLDIIDIHKDDEVREMLGVVQLPDEKSLNDRNVKCYIIFDLDDNFLGIIEFFNISWKNRRAELSILIKAEYRRMGYGYEAIKNMLNIGFNVLGFNRIWLRVLEHNYRAIDLYQRIGFVQEGINREESIRNGKFASQLQMSLLKSEWDG